ncbi:MAG: hypothetical protein DYG89_34460 [Caldilinea sp. CFX5]|nr:hypothetical protein [Caldilinea sp. CFX5]
MKVQRRYSLLPSALMARFWMTGACVQIIDAQDNALFSVAFHPTRNILATGSHEGSVRLWSIATQAHPMVEVGRCLAVRQGWPHRIWDMTLVKSSNREESMLISGGDDGRLQLWHWPSGALEKVLVGHTRAIRALTCTLPTAGTEPLLASGGVDMTVRLWRLADGCCRHVLYDHTGGVLALALRPDGRVLASGGYDNTVRLWDVQDGECLAILPACKDTVRALAFSPDGALLAAGSSDARVQLWDAQTFAHQTVLPGHQTTVAALAFCPTESVLASADFQAVRLWDLRTGQCTQVIDGCYPLIFHPNGKFFFSLQRGHCVPQLIDIQTGQILRTYAGAIGHIYCLQVSADGQFLFGGAEEGVIRIWDSNSGALVRTLTPARIYEQMNITGVRGLTSAQQAALRLLGAVG